MGICISLPAQTKQTNTIFVPAVLGTGVTPADNQYFGELIVWILDNQQYRLTDTPRNASHTLSSVIMPQNMVGETFASQMFVLHLVLRDNSTGGVLFFDDLFYSNPGEISELLVTRLDRLMAYSVVNVTRDAGNYGLIVPEPDTWRSREWFFGALVYWAPRIYVGEGTSTYYVNFGVGLYTDYTFKKRAGGLSNLSIGTGLELAPDWVAITDRESARDLVLEIPLLVKYSFKPSTHFLLAPYAGININLALYAETKPPILAWRAGFQYGVKAGQGMVVIDPWFSMDIGLSSLAIDPKMQYLRYMMHIGIGYRFGVGG